MTDTDELDLYCERLDDRLEMTTAVDGGVQDLTVTTSFEV